MAQKAGHPVGRDSGKGHGEVGEAGEHSWYGKHQERDGHQRGGLVEVRPRFFDAVPQGLHGRVSAGCLFGGVGTATIGAKEGQGHHTEDVEGGEEGRQQGDPEERLRAGDGAVPRCIQDRILAPEAREDGNAREAQGRDEEGDEGEGHGLPKAAHVPDVVGARGVLHAARAEEEQGLEESMVQEVEDGRSHGADAQGHHHVA